MIQSHLTLARYYWKTLLCPGDFAIDATCGNGHDSLTLAQMILTETGGSLFCIDLQKKALDATKTLLEKKLPPSRLKKIFYYLRCHSSFPPLETFPSLIVYNFGYLPGSDKSVMTKTPTTLKSVKNALKLVKQGGMVSMTCYSGHRGGREEEEELLFFAQSLDKEHYRVCHHRWINRSNAPSLLLIQKK